MVEGSDGGSSGGDGAVFVSMVLHAERHHLQKVRERERNCLYRILRGM